jgi:hypothetical protein
MATIKKLLDEHISSGDAKPAAITNGSSGQKFAPKPRGFTAMEDDNGFDVNQDFTQAWHRVLAERGGILFKTHPRTSSSLTFMSIESNVLHISHTSVTC